MNRTDIARGRASTAVKRPAVVLRAEPLTHVRLVDRPPARPETPHPPAKVSHLARFNGWRRDHYVADQLMRVAAIVTGGLLVLGAVITALVIAVRALINGLGGPEVVGGTLLGIAAVVALLAAVGAALGRKDDGHNGYGFHYGKCK